MNRRLTAILRKEFIHIVRDWRSLLIILLMPILMIVLYGYAITMDMRNIRFAVIDEAQCPESVALIRAFDHNRFFLRDHSISTRHEIEGAIQSRRIGMALVIPHDYALRLTRDVRVPVQILVDASDANVGRFLYNYSAQVVQTVNRSRSASLPQVLSVQPRILYNPDMKSSNYFVPGLIALILILISALLTSMTITREKETGTLEQILVSPVRPIEILAGKVIPYVLIGLINASVIVISARLLFDVPFRGSLLTATLLSLVYIFTALSFGLMISTVARTQQIAMFATLMATVLPTIMLSGFIFRVASMPMVLQGISRIVPASYYLVIIRGIMLKGVGVAELWPQALPLLGLGAVMMAVATKRFRTNLEV